MPQEAKKWAGKHVSIKMNGGQSYEGKITNVCNEYCDKWMFYFEDQAEVEVDSVKSIATV